MYTITLPAKYYCYDCREYQADCTWTLRRTKRGFLRVELCPVCKSEKIEHVSVMMPNPNSKLKG